MKGTDAERAKSRLQHAYQELAILAAGQMTESQLLDRETRQQQHAVRLQRMPCRIGDLKIPPDPFLGEQEFQDRRGDLLESDHVRAAVFDQPQQRTHAGLPLLLVEPDIVGYQGQAISPEAPSSEPLLPEAGGEIEAIRLEDGNPGLALRGLHHS